MGTHGTPHVGEVFAFLVGALAGFGLIARVALGTLGRSELIDDPDERVRAGTLNVVAVGGAVAAVALLAEIDSWAAWPLSAFAATALYLVIASLELTIVAVRAKRRVRSGVHG